MWSIRKWIILAAATIALCVWAFALGSAIVKPSTFVTGVVSNVKPEPKPCTATPWDCNDNPPCKNDEGCLGEGCICIEGECQ